MNDIVEATSLHLNLSAYDIFKAVGEKRGWPLARVDSLFDGYVQEDFVKDEVESWCLMQLHGTKGVKDV
jgi:hypothetical protein